VKTICEHASLMDETCRLCAQAALSTALSLLEAVLTADRERHAYLVGEIERLDPAAGAAMLSALAAAPALPLERIAALLHERGRSLRWPEKMTHTQQGGRNG
jgi:hypothetical protein